MRQLPRKISLILTDERDFKFSLAQLAGLIRFIDKIKTKERDAPSAESKDWDWMQAEIQHVIDLLEVEG